MNKETRPNKPNSIEGDELDILLNELERGEAGQLMRAARDGIEPRPQFAQELEARLLANAPKSAHPAQPAGKSMEAGRRGELQTFPASQRRFGRFGRIAPMAWGGLGAAAMVLLLVGMAAMLNLRTQMWGGKQTPVVPIGLAIDTLKLIPNFELLHTIKLSQSTPATRDIRMAWSPTGRILATTTDDSTLLIWGRDAGQPLSRVTFASKINSIQFSPDGSLLALALDWSAKDGGGVLLVEPLTGRTVHRLNRPPSATQAGTTSISWSPDSKLLASTSHEISSYPPADTVPRSSTFSQVGLIRIWDVSLGKEVRTISVPNNGASDGSVAMIAWSPVMKDLYPVRHTLASISNGGALRLWDASTGQMLHHLATNPMYDIAHVEWSPDGRTLAMVAQGQVELWDAASGKLLRKLPEKMYAPPTPIPTVPPTPGKAQNDQPGPPADYYGANSLLWSPDSKTLFTADGGHVRLWDPTNGRVMRSIEDRAFWLALSPDGRALATAGWGDDVVLRYAASGEELRTLPYRQGRYMAWSPDGQMLAMTAGTAGPELAITVWGVRSDTTPAGTPTPTSTRTYEALPTVVPTGPWQPLPPQTPPQTPQGPHVGDAMPDFASIDVRTGVAIKLSELRGKPLVLTFWGTWCPPCRNQLPALEKAYRTHSNDKVGFPHGVSFLNVTMSPRDNQSDVRDFVEKEGYTMAFSHVDKDSYSTLQQMLQLNAVPTTYFVYEDGIIRALHVGEMSAEQLESYLRQHFAEPTPFPTSAPSTSIPTLTPTHTPVNAAATVTTSPQAACGEWSIVSSPNANSINELTSVAAISANDVWAVGYSSIGSPAYVDGTPVPNIQTTLTMHWDGKSWRNVPSPNVEGEKMHNRLTSVSGVASDDVWAVGYYEEAQSYAVGRAAKALILHWDGKEWSVMQDYNSGSEPSQLNSVVAVSKDDVWAVGHRGRDYEPGSRGEATRSETLVLHWDGKKWSQVSSPSPAPFFNKLLAVSASAPDDVWAVGIQSYDMVAGGGGGLAPYPLALHWNGKTWSVSPIVAPNDRNESGKAPLAVAAASKSEVYVVGGNFSEGGSDSAAMVWDGAKWTQAEVHTPKPPQMGPPPQDYLAGVVALSPGNAWAVGSYVQDELKPGYDRTTLVMRWDNKNWIRVPAPDPGSGEVAAGEQSKPSLTSNKLNAIAASPNGELWAVGSSSTTSSIGSWTSNTLIMRYTPGPCGTPVPTP